MIATLQNLLPYGALISHALFIVLLLAPLFRHSWGKGIVAWVAPRAIPLGFIVALLAIAGSLFYSELVGFPPCVLCWWQRVFLFPQAILFGAALWWKKKDVFLYSVPLVLLAAIAALYHQYVYMGGESLLPCTAIGGACSKIYVMAFGYITIPMMSLTAALFLLLLAWYHKIHENRHA
jgi:disulfide bond formation protein DsbB